MPRPSVTERARLYLARVPAAISGSGGHDQTFAAACALVKGFDLSVDEARGLLAEYNARCLPPWNETELEHKLRSAYTAPDDKPRGYLRGDDDDAPVPTESEVAVPALPPPTKPQFDAAALERFAGIWAQRVNLLWLANRSARDPAEVIAEEFLRILYPGENVLVFTSDRTQGEALWPRDALPVEGPRGVWFLSQPVDGEYHPNPRQGNMSRRSAESVTSWRYLVLESDEAPARLWLAALAQLPLRIAAIYSSGARSVHALVRVDARTSVEWNEISGRLAPGLVILGADRKSMTSVRLTRLPGCFRKNTGQLQKLLYINPDPPLCALVDSIARRDVEEKWFEAAAGLASRNWPAYELAKCRAAAEFYARVSTRLRKAALELGELQELIESSK